ncbi:hypothetical protein [Actinosynnema sp. NPDC023587]|uniref:hypothetical protein n=1 Tax=Actinosynnema sp. NPDC023587 TaxID=3154695 RepID=UPI0033DEEA98
MRVYAGLDVITKRRHYLVEVVPAGPDAERLAEEVRVRFLREIDERFHPPRTNATVGFVVAVHITAARLERTTRETYDGYALKHIYPIIGHFKAESLAVDVLDSYYEELERCREHCSGGPEIDHRTPGEHTCDRRCRRHVCKPLTAWTVRKIHFILTGAVDLPGRRPGGSLCWWLTIRVPPSGWDQRLRPPSVVWGRGQVGVVAGEVGAKAAIPASSANFSTQTRDASASSGALSATTHRSRGMEPRRAERRSAARSWHHWRAATTPRLERTTPAIPPGSAVTSSSRSAAVMAAGCRTGRRT